MFRDMKVAPRAALGFGLIALVVLLLGLFALNQMSVMREQSRDVDENWLPSILALSELDRTMLRIRAVTLRLSAVRDERSQQQTLAQLNELLGTLDGLEREYRRYLNDEEERQLYERFTRHQRNYLGEHARLMDFIRAGNDAQAMEVLAGAINQHANDMSSSLGALLDFNRAAAGKAARFAENVYGNAIVGVIVVIVAAALLTILLAWLFTRSLLVPLGQALEEALAVAAGDLTREIRVTGRDEPAQLLDALRTMQGNLRSAVQQIADSSSQLASAAEELNAVTENSSRGLHQQNDQIEQAATAVNEMTSAVEEVARSAVDTSQATGETNRTALQGRDAVKQTVGAIRQLSAEVNSSAGQVGQLAVKVRDIGQVLDVIRAIADQTNLLALNAAIEAARAGDAGRGFAVVADEVRALAHRTQQSTREIEQMIGGVQQDTEQAVGAMQHSLERARSSEDVAQAAGEALEQIAQAIAGINERNLVIASAAEEQAQVAREVDRNLVAIRDLSLQSAAGANQTSAASQELSRLAVGLNGLVTRFRL
ncbi:chemotaxis protein [Pseudomonas flexibilis]|uniref:Chemotaxis protein n=2 Tax=Pseudomonas flexibilis TaxID=706570 RepID=A0A0B3BSY6_9PSED|nr:chemotaxis protein [Pseudomonas flexibilis]SCX77356.1 methyl-accepting chemotaxis protein [Pseudomonas flexibilis]